MNQIDLLQYMVDGTPVVALDKPAQVMEVGKLTSTVILLRHTGFGDAQQEVLNATIHPMPDVEYRGVIVTTWDEKQTRTLLEPMGVTLGHFDQVTSTFEDCIVPWLVMGDIDPLWGSLIWMLETVEIIAES